MYNDILQYYIHPSLCHYQQNASALVSLCQPGDIMYTCVQAQCSGTCGGEIVSPCFDLFLLECVFIQLKANSTSSPVKCGFHLYSFFCVGLPFPLLIYMNLFHLIVAKKAVKLLNILCIKKFNPFYPHESPNPFSM